jgi:hypothetical protein
MRIMADVRQRLWVVGSRPYVISSVIFHRNAIQFPSHFANWVRPVGGPSTPVQPPSINKVLPLT